jgi:phage terminase large subunit-like protein
MVIIEWIRSLVDDGLYPMAVAYDGWHVDDWTERELKRLCGESRVHTVPQYAKVLSPLMKEQRLDLKAKRIINDSPVTHWARMNVEVSVDNNDNYMPRKKNLDPHKKIDPYMAELFAFKAYKLHEEEYVNMINGSDE